MKKYLSICALLLLAMSSRAQLTLPGDSAGTGAAIMDISNVSYHRPTPEENARYQAAAAEEKKRVLLKKEEEERQRKLAKRNPQPPPPPKPYVLVQKYTFATPQVYGYIDLGNGKGRREISEAEYRALVRQYPQKQ